MRSIKLLEDTIELTVPAKAQYLSSIRQLAFDAAQSASLGEDETQDFNLAVIEAATNAIRHSKCDRITVAFTTDADGVTARVIDKGCGFKFNARRRNFPSPEKQGGRGIPLMHNLVDSVKVESRADCGTEVVLVKKARRQDLRTASLR
jgi:serine/threonine-protein kinase RsbW